jgi:hypothetical protein
MVGFQKKNNGFYCGKTCRTEALQFHTLQHFKSQLFNMVYHFLKQQPMGQGLDVFKVSRGLCALHGEKVKQWYNRYTMTIDLAQSWKDDRSNNNL